MNASNKFIESESYRWAGRFRWESTAIGRTRLGPVHTPVRGRTCACRISGTGARRSRDRWNGSIACRAGTSNCTELKRCSSKTLINEIDISFQNERLVHSQIGCTDFKSSKNFLDFFRFFVFFWYFLNFLGFLDFLNF